MAPKTRGALRNYLAVNDRILSTTFLTKSGLFTIINHSAPDENSPYKEKQAHWDALSTHISKIPPTNIIILMGDCNLRGHGRRSDETDFLGPHIFGCGTPYIKTHPHENRDLGVEFLRTHSLFYMNSKYKKESSKLHASDVKP